MCHHSKFSYRVYQFEKFIRPPNHNVTYRDHQSPVETLNAHQASNKQLQTQSCVVGHLLHHEVSLQLDIIP